VIVTFEKTVPAIPIVEPVGISAIDKLMWQMEELRLEHAELLCTVKWLLPLIIIPLCSLLEILGISFVTQQHIGWDY